MFLVLFTTASITPAAAELLTDAYVRQANNESPSGKATQPGGRRRKP